MRYLCQYWLNQSLSYMLYIEYNTNKAYCWVLHGRTRIDFNQPNIKVRINHKIVAKHLMCIISMYYHLSCSQYTSDDTLLDLRLDPSLIDRWILILFNKESFILISAPHVSFNSWILEVFWLTCDTVVGKMHEFIVDFCRIIVISSKS